MSEVERQPYIYHPLNRDRKEIRLVYVVNLAEIRFLAETIDADPEISSDSERVQSLEKIYPVCCTIKHVSLEQSPPYSGLSYTWGNADRKRRLVIEEDGKSFDLSITANLDSALRHIVVDGELWIDAVCINQADEVEKSWQVQQMWSIYSGAEYTAAWLGTAADDSDLLLEQICNISNLLGQAIQGKAPHELMYFMKLWTPPVDAISLPALSALVMRPYWCRVWIQQELQASRNVWFHCGAKRIHITLVLGLLARLEAMRAKLRQQNPGIVPRDSFAAYLGTIKSNQEFIIASRAIMRHGSRPLTESSSLVQLLRNTYIFGRGLKASDSRDFVYGFLNMSRDASELGVVADYSKSPHDLFLQIAMAFIKQIGLKLLTWGNLPDNSQVGPPFSSWAPDWSIPILRPLAEFGLKSDFRFTASGDSQSQFQIIKDKDGYPTLSTGGLLVDIVQAIGNTVLDIPISNLSWYSNDQDPNLDLALRWLDDIQTLSAHCGRVYLGSSGTKEAIWRTPIGDMEFTPEGKYQRASQSMEKCYQLCRSGILRAVVKSTELQQQTERFALAAKYWRSMVTRCSNRRLFATKQGYLGLGPATVKNGDIIVVMLGLDTPLVLRTLGEDRFKLVGEVYVHGIMDGEAMKGSPSTQIFNIC